MSVTALTETLARVLADRLQHPEARLAAGDVLRPEQVVAEERLDGVDNIEHETSATAWAPSSVNPPTNTPRLGKSPAPRRPGGRSPLDRVAQRPVPRRRSRAGLSPQQLEPGPRRHDRAWREKLDPRGSELDRERKPVKAETQLDDRVGVGIRELEVGPDIACSIDEQPHGLRARDTA